MMASCRDGGGIVPRRLFHLRRCQFGTCERGSPHGGGLPRCRFWPPSRRSGRSSALPFSAPATDFFGPVAVVRQRPSRRPWFAVVGREFPPVFDPAVLGSWGRLARRPDAPWRTRGQKIPRGVASPQSPTPFLLVPTTYAAIGPEVDAHLDTCAMPSKILRR